MTCNPCDRSSRPSLAVASLTTQGCWPAAPIAAYSAGNRHGGHDVDPAISIRGHIITDPTDPMVTGIATVLPRPPYAANPTAPPTLSLSADQVDFGTTGAELVVQARNSGGGTLNVTSIQLTPTIGTDPTWLTATLRADGKTIALVADRTLLPTGEYGVHVDVFSDGGTGSFLVFVTVGTSMPTPIGPVIVDVLASDAVSRLARVIAIAADGYAWTMPRLPRGSYFLVAGVDLDSNEQLGDPGEPFGTYPIAISPQLIEVDALDDLAIDLLVQ